MASADDAVATARDFGYPVVLKTADPAHSHKTEVDGVKNWDSTMTTRWCPRLYFVQVGLAAGVGLLGGLVTPGQSIRRICGSPGCAGRDPGRAQAAVG